MENKDKNHNKKKIIVNTITSLRLLATLAIAPIYFTFGGIAAAATAATFLLTDFIDGKLARKWHVQTFLGSILDSVSDKTLAITSLLALSTTSKLFLIPIALELSILATNYATFKLGGNVQSNLIGKLKAWPLGAGITLGFLASDVTKLQTLTSVTEQTAKTLLESAAVIPTIACGATLASYCYSLYQTSLTNDTIQKIQSEKDHLRLQKKSIQEIMQNLVDTDFYLENKDEQILKLLYKNPKM